jgi:hypothetical protein
VAAGSTDTSFSVGRLGRYQLCFTGLDVSDPPSVVITTPTGARETETATASGANWLWAVDATLGEGATSNLGRYTFRVVTPDHRTGASASSTPSGGASVSPGPSGSPRPTSPRGGTITTSGRFTVVLAKAPRAVIAGRGEVSPGEQLRIWLAGFPDHSVVYLTVFGPGNPPIGQSSTYPLLVDLPDVSTAGRGEAIARWTVPSGTSAGAYVVWIDPPITAGFDVARCGQPCLPFAITS